MGTTILGSDGKTVTIVPKDGYVIKDVIIDGKSMGAINTYIIEGKITVDTKIEIIFEKANASRFDRFTDVKGHWAEAAIQNVVEKGYLVGLDEKRFGPQEDLSRGMAVLVLYKLAGAPSVDVMSSFKDVSSAVYYATAAAWAKENGVVKGYEDATLRPDNTVTREEFAQMLSNLAIYRSKPLTGAEEGQLQETFVDWNHISPWALKAVCEMVGSEIMNGTPKKQLQPGKNIDRAEMASMLYHYLSL